MTPATSAASYSLSISLPEDFKCLLNQTIPAFGKIHNVGGAYSNYTPISATTVANNTVVTVQFNAETATFLPTNAGANYINFSTKFLVKK